MEAAAREPAQNDYACTPCINQSAGGRTENGRPPREAPSAMKRAEKPEQEKSIEADGPPSHVPSSAPATVRSEAGHRSHKFPGHQRQHAGRQKETRPRQKRGCISQLQQVSPRLNVQRPCCQRGVPEFFWISIGKLASVQAAEHIPFLASLMHPSRRRGSAFVPAN